MEKQLFVTKSVTETKSSDVEGVGTLRWVGNNCYRWVYNNHSTGFVEGSVVFHTFSDGANALEKIADGATADLGFMAGIVMAETLAAGEYGWIQCLGYNATALVLPDTNATPAAGATLKGVNGQSYATGQDVEAMGSPPLYTRNLVLLEAVTKMTTPAATSTKVYVNCL